MWDGHSCPSLLTLFLEVGNRHTRSHPRELNRGRRHKKNHPTPAPTGAAYDGPGRKSGVSPEKKEPSPAGTARPLTHIPYVILSQRSALTRRSLAHYYGVSRSSLFLIDQTSAKNDRPKQSTNRFSICKRVFSALYVCLSLPTLPHSAVISGR